MSRYAVATSPSPTRVGFETQAYVPFEIVYFDHILSRVDVRELLTQSVGGGGSVTATPDSILSATLMNGTKAFLHFNYASE